MADQPVLKSLKINGLLSFSDAHLDLGPLNVLIGPNGSGKSNLIEIIGLLQSAPRDLGKPIREGGGVGNWMWKGTPQKTSGSGPVRIETVVSYPSGQSPIRYRLEFDIDTETRLAVKDESFENSIPHLDDVDRPIFHFGYRHGRPTLNLRGDRRELRWEDIDPQQSMLSQRKDPDLYPELTYVGRLFESFRFYREWGFGRLTAPRDLQPADSRNDFLEENLSNLGLVLNGLRQNANVKRDLLKNLRLFYEDAEDFDVNVKGGTVQVFLQERYLPTATPATRLSDGTLRWLCLLAILLHPSPPPLVCLEEPELGFHPDMIPTLAHLLREASERMQLIVTTHSDVLVDALSDTPDSIIVCEKENGATRLKRLSGDELSVWLEKYSLGELWRSGEIGGNRW